MSRRGHAISLRGQRLLEALIEAGSVPTVRDERLRAVVAGERALYEGLIVLRGRMLVRWDEGGVNIRPTRAGRDLMKQAFYRGR